MEFSISVAMSIPQYGYMMVFDPTVDFCWLYIQLCKTLLIYR